jgi:Ca2+/Na+ antiporter
MNMFLDLLILVVAGGATVAAVRFPMMSGIRGLAAAFRFSTKTTGQVIGYATSLPELTVLVASALSGVFDAGFWNIASSNIINCGLFISAIVFYRQHAELRRHLFRDELVFVVASVVIPMALAGSSLSLSYPIAGGLLLLFVVYRLADAHFNRVPAAQKREAMRAGTTPPDGRQPSLPASLGLIGIAIAVMLVSGRFLGGAAANLIDELGVPGWALGWVLGIITSLPEMTSFFEIFRARHEAGIIDETLDDTQEALDALVSSNMCNLALILPIGTICYLLVAG